MSYQGQVQNKPTAAYILSLLGGIFGLLAGLGVMASGAILYSAFSSATDIYGNPIDATGLFGLSWIGLIGFGIWMLITSILIIVFAGKLKSNPMEHSKWGALILVFSIIGVGGLFGLIGGILALVYKPMPIQGYQQPYAQPGAYQQPYAQPAPAYQQPYAQPVPNYPQQNPQPQYVQQPQYTQQQSQQEKITRICPKCGRVVNENARFCPFCGNQLG